jgi:hypothetical protein
MKWQKRLRAPLGARETIHVALSEAATGTEDPPMTAFPHPAPAG